LPSSFIDTNDQATSIRIDFSDAKIPVLQELHILRRVFLFFQLDQINGAICPNVLSCDEKESILAILPLLRRNRPEALNHFSDGTKRNPFTKDRDFRSQVLSLSRIEVKCNGVAGRQWLGKDVSVLGLTCGLLDQPPQIRRYLSGVVRRRLLINLEESD